VSKAWISSRFAKVKLSDDNPIYQSEGNPKISILSVFNVLVANISCNRIYLSAGASMAQAWIFERF